MSATLGDRYENKTFFVTNADHMSLIWRNDTVKFINCLIDNAVEISDFPYIYEECSTD